MAKIRTGRYHNRIRFSENIRNGANEIMGAFKVSIEIGDSQSSKFETIETLANAGAMYTMIPRSNPAGLGISPDWRRTFTLADGREGEFDMAQAAVRMDGATSTTIVVFDEEGSSPLLGTYTLGSLGLTVDPSGKRLVELVGHL